MAVEQLLSLVRSGPSRQLHQVANLVLNAERIVRDLGELKGAAMKVGQMLSLQDALLPPEVTGVLRDGYQREAPLCCALAFALQNDASLSHFVRGSAVSPVAICCKKGDNRC